MLCIKATVTTPPADTARGDFYSYDKVARVDRQLWTWLLSQADTVNTYAEHYHPDALFERNDAVIDAHTLSPQPGTSPSLLYTHSSTVTPVERNARYDRNR